MPSVSFPRSFGPAREKALSDLRGHTGLLTFKHLVIGVSRNEPYYRDLVRSRS